MRSLFALFQGLLFWQRSICSSHVVRAKKYDREDLKLNTAQQFHYSTIRLMTAHLWWTTITNSNLTLSPLRLCFNKYLVLQSTYSNKEERSCWVEQHTLDKAFGFLEGTLQCGMRFTWLRQVNVLHKTLNLVTSRCCFTENAKEMYQNVNVVPRVCLLPVPWTGERPWERGCQNVLRTC